MKKFISAVTSICMTATMLGAVVPASVGAADASKGYSIRTFGGASSVISAADIAAGDVKIPCAAYITEETSDITSFQLNLGVSDKSADPSAVVIKGYDPDLEPYYSEAQSFTTGDGQTFSSNKAVFFAGSVNSRGSYKAHGSYITMSDASLPAANIDNYFASYVWTNGGSDYEWIGAKSDDYPVMYFDVTFKKGAAAGDYVIDFNTFNTNGQANQYSNQINVESTQFAEANGNLNLEPLTIKIEGGSAPVSTTTTTVPKPVATTTTTKAPTPPPSDGITVDFGKYNAKPGDVVAVDAIITANGKLICGFLGVAKVDSPLTLEIIDSSPAFNDKDVMVNATTNQFTSTLVNGQTGDGLAATDGAAILSLDVKVPANCPDGVYTITADNFELIADGETNTKYDFTLIDGTITVGNPVPATTTTTTAPKPIVTTTTPVGTVLYGDANCDGKVNVADVVVLNKYLTDATAYDLTAQGKINAEVDLNDDLNFDDSKSIIESIVHLVTLPITK